MECLCLDVINSNVLAPVLIASGPSFIHSSLFAIGWSADTAELSYTQKITQQILALSEIYNVLRLYRWKRKGTSWYHGTCVPFVQLDCASMNCRKIANAFFTALEDRERP